MKRSVHYVYVDKEVLVCSTSNFTKICKKAKCIVQWFFLYCLLFNTFALVVFYDRLVKDGFKGDENMTK